MDTAELHTKIAEIVAAWPFGKASAAKRGRRQEWPYVPVIDHGEQKIGIYRSRTEQITKRAFATRDEAVRYAERVIEARKDGIRRRLLDPACRAFREHVGLPREI